MIRSDLDTRKAIEKLDAQKRALRKTLPAAARQPRPSRAQPRGKGQREPRQKDAGYLNWLHDLPCIACMISGPPPADARKHIEAAHQKLAIASRGWKEGGAGPRVHDKRCVPLCCWHHRDGLTSCDNGQRKFWDRLNIGDAVADLCAQLYTAYQSNQDGRSVISGFVGRGR